jgi:U4/U6.U5 tri-snRNP-associated protein 2
MQIHDSSLDDIKRSLRPTFTLEAVRALDANMTLARDVHGVSYLPGFVGINNLKCTDYINVILHVIVEVHFLSFACSFRNLL